MATITPSALSHLLAENPEASVIDVRTPLEFGEVHATAAENIPLDSFDPARFPADKPVYILCQSGQRAGKAAALLEKSGHPNAVVVEGGTLAWIKAGLPVTRSERSVISLERQIRIAAGSFVFIGFLLGTFVHPRFFAFSGLIGFALVITGITGWCGMGLLLAKAPWNK